MTALRFIQRIEQELRPQELRPQELRPQELRPQELRPQELRPQELRPTVLVLANARFHHAKLVPAKAAT